MINYDLKNLKDEFQAHTKDFIEYFYQETQNPKIRSLMGKKEISPLEYYWLTQEVKLWEIEDMLEKEEYDLAFDEWNKSQYAKYFFDFSKDEDIALAHQKTLQVMKHDINNFYSLQIEGFLLTPSKEYIPRKEIGDTKKSLGIKNRYSIPNTHLKITGKFSEKEIAKIQKAYLRLKSFSPKSFIRLQEFSHTIIPTKQKEIVSFSNQNLPGFSTINMENRDDIDLMDDLIHENGHHHLNYFLNTRELIIETEDKDFFSPWRETFRPIRGIYHGYMTFAWAVILFRDILIHPELTSEFTLKEQLKVQDRLIEELAMMLFCRKELESSSAQVLITDEGKKLMKNIDGVLDEIYYRYIDKISLIRFNAYSGYLERKKEQARTSVIAD